jgi:hypothetical protein
MDDPDDELVTVYHPGIDQTALVTRRGLRDLYEVRGWVLQPEAVRRASEVLRRPVGDLDSLTVAELEQVLDGLGISRTIATTKGGLLALLDPDNHPPKPEPDKEPNQKAAPSSTETAPPPKTSGKRS